MRLFIAITLPQQVQQQLADYAAGLAVLAQRARPTRRDNFHLTLAFLGEALNLAEACAALEAVGGAPFKLYSDKPGLFKRAGADIHWLGIKNSAELTALHKELASALAALGFVMENRPFSPHITLAREVRGLAGELPPPPRFVVPVNALTLMNSERLGGLLTYTPLHAKSLFSSTYISGSSNQNTLPWPTSLSTP